VAVADFRLDDLALAHHLQDLRDHQGRRGHQVRHQRDDHQARKARRSDEVRCDRVRQLRRSRQYRGVGYSVHLDPEPSLARAHLHQVVAGLAFRFLRLGVQVAAELAYRQVTSAVGLQAEAPLAVGRLRAADRQEAASQRAAASADARGVVARS